MVYKCIAKCRCGLVRIIKLFICDAAANLLFFLYMVKDVTEIFNSVKEKYKEHGLPLQLTAGGLCDVKGEGTSDVDISLFHITYYDLDHIFIDSTVTHYPEERATIYSIRGFEREVNIYATDDMKRIEMAVKHRENELKLNQYPLLLSAAIVLKKLGESTEEAWVKALNLQQDGCNAFEIMARNNIVSIAKNEEDRLKALVAKLQK